MIKNLILSGGINHDFDASSQALASLMAQLGVRSHIITDIENISALLAAENYQILTVNALRWQMSGEKYDDFREQWAFCLSPEDGQAISSFVKRGSSLLGIHTASICFDDWVEWQAILGGIWHWGESFHPPQGPVEVLVTGRDDIVKGCQSFVVSDEVYSNIALVEGLEPLLVSGQPNPGQPLLWKHHYGRGRVVYDALGHDAASLEEPTHKLILQRAVEWLLQSKI